MNNDLRKDPHKWADAIENRIKLIATAVFIIGLFVLSILTRPNTNSTDPNRPEYCDQIQAENKSNAQLLECLGLDH